LIKKGINGLPVAPKAKILNFNFAVNKSIPPPLAENFILDNVVFISMMN